MASRRMIDPGFWQSESVARLPIAVRYFFIGLFSNADDQGRMKAHPALLRSKLYPYDDIDLTDVERMLEWLCGDFISVYEIDGKEYLQILNWWKYQRPRWAWPSEHPAPEGWKDRVHYRQGNAVMKENWDDPQPNVMPSPDDDESHGGATVEPPRNHSGTSAEPAPSGSISGSGSGSTSGSDRKKEIGADAPPTPQPQKRKRNSRPKEPPPPAIARYRTVMNLYPERSLWPGIVEVVGRDPPDLDRWERVIRGWLACGWNKRNVKGMLEHYVQHRIPGDGKKPTQYASGKDSADPQAFISGEYAEWVEH